MSTQEDLDHAVRRAVGIAALRRLRRLINEERREEAENRLLARRIAWGLAAAAAVAALWLISRALH
ncbi:MAG: hypothetical protein KA603_01960 [Azonexus sp.]|nr:hypothetical protein [Betaproteobacteria bacterium]MBK8919644.1 hypothetical protein [Betaproteobacteria bacterium]MBP6034885.1 hypothetical protein [Azonexus sp.]MBP6905591.1 hypothetical protein [Azonexus sp.]